MARMYGAEPTGAVIPALRARLRCHTSAFSESARKYTPASYMLARYTLAERFPASAAVRRRVTASFSSWATTPPRRRNSAVA